MKILAISHLYPHQDEPRYGVFVARQLKAIAEQGHNIAVLVPSVYCPGVLTKFKRWENYNNKSSLINYDLDASRFFYLRLPGNWYNRWSGLAAYLSIKKMVKQLHTKEKFDVIYANDFFPDVDIATKLSDILGIPTVGVCVGIDVNQTAQSNSILRNHFIQVSKSVSGIISRGEGVAQLVRQIAKRDSLCVYGVVDFEKFHPVEDKSKVRDELSLSKNCIYLLYVGYLDRQKGLYELLDTFSQLKDNSRVKLVLCGDGSQREGLKKYAVEKDINDSIIMAGTVAPEQMNKWMQASDVFVLPSHSEGMPNVVMEAMSCGVPVVATKVGGLPDAVGDSEGAILVEPKDVKNLCYAIDRIISNYDLRIQMGKAARRLAKEKFGVKQNAKRIIDYLQMIIEKENSSHKRV